VLPVVVLPVVAPAYVLLYELNVEDEDGFRENESCETTALSPSVLSLTAKSEPT